MTAVAYSPEQLDAEAAACQPWEPTAWRIALQQRLADLRYDYRQESAIMVLTSTAPPATLDLDAALIVEEPAAVIGRTLSAPLLSLIGAHRADGAHYDRARHPVHASLSAWERRCRRDHRQVPGRAPMWTDHRGGPLCALLAYALIRDQFSVNAAALWCGVPYPRAERILDEASRFVRRSVIRWEDERDWAVLA